MVNKIILESKHGRFGQSIVHMEIIFKLRVFISTGTKHFPLVIEYFYGKDLLSRL